MSEQIRDYISLKPIAERFKEVAFSDILATITDKSGYFLVRDVK